MGLHAFTAGYIEAALFTEMDESDESGGKPLDRNYSADDITDDAEAQIGADCEAFYTANSETWDRHLLDDTRAGQCFWLSRNGHGAGFFDEDHIEDEDDRNTLQEAAEAFGEANLYVGDDGRLYYSNG